MKNKKWTELQSLQRTKDFLSLDGLSDENLRLAQKQIDRIKDDIRRQAAMQSDNMALLQHMNRKEMVRLMLLYGFTIKSKDFLNWRPTQRHIGDIGGVSEGVTIIATDGLLAYYVNSNTSVEDKQAFCGHVDWFVDTDGKPIEVKSLYSCSNKSAAGTRPRKAPQTQEQKAMELLKKLQS